MKEQEIRRIVNEYSRETAGHPFKDYGNDIKITVNDDCTIFECIVRTQYEERNTEEKCRPYRGGAIAPQKYFSLRDINAWAFNLKVPEDFTDKNTDIEVQGSARVQQCFPCSGKGSRVCTTCLGKSREKCPVCHGNYKHLSCETCNGTGYVLCPTCRGQCEVYCDKCSGKGTIRYKTREQQYQWDYRLNKQVLKEVEVERTKNCEACHGRGHWRCGTCRDTTEKRGYVRCRTCGNMGYVTCTNCTQGEILCKTCSGKGSLVCSSCQGAGQNEFRYIVKRSLREETLRSYVCDKRVIEFAEGYDLTYQDVDFNTRQSSLGENLFPENVRCSSALSKLVGKSAPDSGRILFQEATVQHVETVYLEYEYDGDEYSGIICDGYFYPDNSPIDDWSADLVKNAEKKMKMGSSASSLKMLDQAEMAGADSDDISALRSKVFTKLENIHAAGVSTAFWFFVVVVTPIVYNFYSKLNPVAPWAIVSNNPGWRFYGLLPLVQTLLFLGLLLAARIMLYDRSSTASRKSHSSIWVYFAGGFGGFFLAGLVALAVLVAVNYFGLSIITSFILGIAIIIVAFVITIVFLLLKWVFGLIARIF